MKKTLLLATLAVLSSAHAYEAKITKGQLPATLTAMLTKASSDTGTNFDPSTVELIEERELATSQFSMYVQATEVQIDEAGTMAKIPVAGTAIRVWKNKQTGELILAEMHLNEKHEAMKPRLVQQYHRAGFHRGLKSQGLTNSIQNMVNAEIKAQARDTRVLSLKSQDVWENGDLVRKVTVKGSRGMHLISISLFRNKIIKSTFSEYPQSENLSSIQANVYPMYEEVEATGQLLGYEVRELKYIEPSVRDGGKNPYSDLEGFTYTMDRYNPLIAETEVGQALGIWSEASIRRQVESIVKTLPEASNDFSSGLLLQGKYATINLHPDVVKFAPSDFDLRVGVNHTLMFDESNNAKPVPGFYGKAISSPGELLTRVPFRLPDHDPAKYMSTGFDEAQVYYAVTTLMEALAEMGFKDPELSVRPFHAFLYNPDITMKDNAFYTDDTINFTTYSAGHINLARDNSTIWHELGHGVMERLMGGFLTFSDSGGSYGGLSEGMADFVAKLIVEHQTNGQDFPGKYDFRIMNNTGLYLTNEFHDDGEAYGGSMADMLADAMKAQGRAGLYKFSDLTLETMRLTRNHPSLSPRGWFEHMIYADALGSDVRAPGEFAGIIKQALSSRNFAFESSFEPAAIKITSDLGELTNSSQASREKPVKACDPSGSVSYNLKLKLSAGDAQFIKFPATVKIEYKAGALQGAIRWAGEESNPTVYTVNSEDEVLDIPLKASMACDEINQPDGSCKDYAYIQVYNQGEKKPLGKKRFYLQIKDKSDCSK